LNTINQTKP